MITGDTVGGSWVFYCTFPEFTIPKPPFFSDPVLQ